MITPPTTALPKNVFYFEVLLYASLFLDALSVAFRDRSLESDAFESTLMIANLLTAGLLMLFVYLVWLAAYGRKSWPRWVLGVSLAVSVLSLSQVLATEGLQFDNFIDLLSCLLTGGGLVFAFSGDAKDWFTE
jgi:glucan phosphoethanolaminetransferase (alkaline phosphatase superfamily)